MISVPRSFQIKFRRDTVSKRNDETSDNNIMSYCLILFYYYSYGTVIRGKNSKERERFWVTTATSNNHSLVEVFKTWYMSQLGRFTNPSSQPIIVYIQIFNVKKTEYKNKNKILINFLMAIQEASERDSPDLEYLLTRSFTEARKSCFWHLL